MYSFQGVMNTEAQGERMAGEMVVDGYEALRAHLTDIVASGKIRAQMAVEREKVRTYWEMGQVLHGYLLDAPYEHGAHVVARLSGDLRIGRRTVCGIMEFYEKFPGVRAGAQLTWTHYRRLCALPTLRLRRAYLNAAEAVGDLGDGGFHQRTIRHIQRERLGPSAAGGNFIDHALRGGAVHICDHDRRARARQRHGRNAADAVAAAGDHGDIAVDAEETFNGYGFQIYHSVSLVSKASDLDIVIGIVTRF